MPKHWHVYVLFWYVHSVRSRWTLLLKDNYRGLLQLKKNLRRLLCRGDFWLLLNVLQIVYHENIWLILNKRKVIYVLNTHCTRHVFHYVSLL